MPTPYQTHVGSFTRESTCFWAAVGSTVGLANLWQFPYLASMHGGGLFILLYLACLLLVTLPLMVTEAAIGRYARHGIVLAMDGLIRSVKRSRAWMAVGRLSILAAFLVLSFTAVFGSIALAYVFFGALGRFSGAGDAEAAAILAGLVSDPHEYRMFMGWHIFFLLLVIWVSAQGVVKGLERTLRVVVPGTLVLMLVLFALAVWYGRLDGAVGQILAMHPEDLSWGSLKAALFHAFFTLGLGMGVWAILGSYTTPHTRLKRSVLAAVLMDTLVAIIAGLMIFAMATDGNRFDGERGFSLLFVSMPVTLAQLPASQFVIATVFLVVVLIVWATSLNLLEPIVGWFREWTGAPRGLSLVLIGLAVWLAGLASLLSFNVWAQERVGGAIIFRWLELVTGGLLIPLAAILIALFAGWGLTRHLSITMLGSTPTLFAGIWLWVMRLVSPLVVAWIGVQYTAFSLSNLCDNGSTAVWCESPVTLLSRDRALPLEAPAQARGPAESSGGGAVGNETVPTVEQSPPAENDKKGKSGEKTPKEDDILYHSV